MNIKKFSSHLENSNDHRNQDDPAELKDSIEKLIGDRIYELSGGSTREFKSGVFSDGVSLVLQSILDEIDNPSSKTTLH